jgi:hypothetical protein
MIDSVRMNGEFELRRDFRRGGSWLRGCESLALLPLDIALVSWQSPINRDWESMFSQANSMISRELMATLPSRARGSG